MVGGVPTFTIVIGPSFKEAIHAGLAAETR